MLRLDLLAEDACYSLQGVPVEQMAGKTVLLSGATGILGTHFLYGLAHCQSALHLPIRVVAIAHRGIPEHLQSLGQQGYVHFLCGNLAELDFLASLPKADLIIHAATYGQPSLFIEHSLETLKLNTTTTFALLDKMLPTGKFLFISSSEVYSGLLTPPFSENEIGTTNTDHPRACYIEAKRCGEAICMSYQMQGIDARSARVSLGYGPGVRLGDKRVLHAFIERALREGSIRLKDQGRAKRTYCYIRDSVNMLWRILLQGTSSLYNVGGISTTTIADLALMIGEILDVPVHFPPEADGGLAGAPDEVSLNLSRFTREFGPMNFTDLHTGLTRTIDWQKSLHMQTKTQLDGDLV